MWDPFGSFPVAQTAFVSVSSLPILLSSTRKLYELFSQYGHVLNVEHKRKKENDNPFSGHYIVEYNFPFEAEAAISCLNGSLQYGRQLRINWGDRPCENKKKDTTVEIFFTFKSKQLNYLVYESTISALMGNFTPCPVLDVTFGSYKIDEAARRFSGTGFIHFPHTTEGVAAVQDIVRAFSSMGKIDGVQYDARVGYSTAKRTRPGVLSSASSVRSGDISTGSATARSTSSSVTTTTYTTSEDTNSSQTSFGRLPYAELCDMVHLIPAPPAEAVRPEQSGTPPPIPIPAPVLPPAPAPVPPVLPPAPAPVLPPVLPPVPPVPPVLPPAPAPVPPVLVPVAPAPVPVLASVPMQVVWPCPPTMSAAQSFMVPVMHYDAFVSGVGYAGYYVGDGGGGVVGYWGMVPQAPQMPQEFPHMAQELPQIPQASLIPQEMSPIAAPLQYHEQQQQQQHQPSHASQAARTYPNRRYRGSVASSDSHGHGHGHGSQTDDSRQSSCT